MSDCIFCKIANGEIPAETVLSTEKALAFRDINPQAPSHILVIPREHVPKISDLTHDHDELITELIHLGNEIAAKEGLAERGYRFVFNCGKDGGQEVEHIHLHILGGRKMNWPPG